MKLLLIDPDPVAREALRKAVQAGMTCEVEGVDDFAVGWTMLTEAEPPFDAVFADPSAADETSFEWLRQMRTATWACPITVVLGFAPNATTMDRALAIGARHFIFKPYSVPTIAAKLRQIARARAYFNFEPVGLPS